MIARLVARSPHRGHSAVAARSITAPSGWTLQPRTPAARALPCAKVARRWEPWHFGFGLNPASRPTAGDGEGGPDLQSFVPSNLEPTIAAAAQRWNVSGVLL